MKDNKRNISSRGFLKTATMVGAALAVEPVLAKATKASFKLISAQYQTLVL